MPQPGSRKQPVPNRASSILDVCTDPFFHTWEISGLTPSQGAQFGGPPCLPIAMPSPTPYRLPFTGYDPFPILVWRLDLDPTHYIRVRLSCTTPFPTVNIGIILIDSTTPPNRGAAWEGSFDHSHPTTTILTATAACYLPPTLTLTLDPP